MASFTAAPELAVAVHHKPSLSPAASNPNSASPPISISLSRSLRIPPPLESVSARNGRAPVVAAGTKRLIGSLTKTDGLKFAIVVARFNEVVTNLLVEGALETFKQYSVDDDDITIVKVPGSFEIPVVAQQLGKSGNFDAVLCIGAVIRGDTTHYDAVANSAASGVLNAGLSSGVPCVFGVLTCDNMDQALNRAGGKAGNKGAEAALTAIEMASLFKHHLPK